MPVSAAQVAVVLIIVTAKGRAKPKLNDAQSVHADDVIDEAIPMRGLPVLQTVFGGGLDANVAVWKLPRRSTLLAISRLFGTSGSPTSSEHPPTWVG